MPAETNSCVVFYTLGYLCNVVDAWKKVSFYKHVKELYLMTILLKSTSVILDSLSFLQEYIWAFLIGEIRIMITLYKYCPNLYIFNGYFIRQLIMLKFISCQCTIFSNIHLPFKKKKIIYPNIKIKLCHWCWRYSVFDSKQPHCVYILSLNLLPKSFNSIGFQ